MRARASPRQDTRIVSIHRLSVKWAKIIVWINHRPRHVVSLNVHLNCLPSSLIFVRLLFLSLLRFHSLFQFPSLNSWNSWNTVRKNNKEFSVDRFSLRFESFSSPVLRCSIEIDLSPRFIKRDVPFRGGQAVSRSGGTFNTKFQLWDWIKTCPLSFRGSILPPWLNEFHSPGSGSARCFSILPLL